MEKVKVTYLGQCGFLLECNGIRIVTDPYLSDYVDRNFYTEETPWKRLYPAPVSLDDIRPDGIVISHAHGDHLDPWTLAPYIEKANDVLIAVPAPVADAVSKLGCRNIVHARAGKSFDIKGVTVTPVPCAHTQLHTDEYGRFCELSYLIDFGNGNVIFFGGDMSLYDGLADVIAGASPSLLLLPVNGRDDDRTGRDIIGNINAEEAAWLSKSLNVPFVPMHHDLYEINRCPEGYAQAAALAAGASVRPLKPMEHLEI